MSSQHSRCVVAGGERIYTVGGVVRGGLWLYAASLLNNVTGFLYWLVISALAGPEVVGVVSAIVGLSTLITTLLSLGTVVSVQRFYGMAIGRGDRNALSIYFWTHLAYLATVYSVASLTILLLAHIGVSVSGLRDLMLVFASICVVLSVAQAAQSLVVSMLKTEIVFVASAIGNIAKFATGLYLVSRGYGWIGAAIGYICSWFTACIVFFAYALKKISLKPVVSVKALASIVNAGIAYWIPNALNIIGMHLGVLIIFGTSGAVETGLYYVASAIAGLVFMLSTSILNLLLPMLSGLERGREESARRVLRVSSLIMFPLATYLILYPWLPLSLLGRTYVKASPILSILLLGALPTTILNCITNFVYAYGMYRYVLLMGLATNVPRVILYNLIVPLYQGLGAALAFTIGSFSGFVTSLVIAHRMRFKVGLSTVAIAYLIPFTTASVLYAIHAPWYVTAIATLVACAVAYPRLGIIKKDDLRDIGYALIGRDKTMQLYSILKPIIDALFRE